MGTDVPVRCACGGLRGTARDVGPKNGMRVVCYCDDCQAFARFLGTPGIMDPRGGTEIFQMPPGRLRLDAAGTLRAVRLSDKGMYRWYCGGCKTPLGNMVGPKLPFIGVIASIMDTEATGRSREELGGPPAHVQTRFALGEGPIEETSKLRFFARVARKLLRWKLTGAGSPSPFFDATGAPRGPVEVMTKAERGAATVSARA